MRLAHLFALSVMFGSAVAACGDDGGGGGGNVDAPIVVDAPMIDAPTPLTGLGQRCGQGMPACPANAPQCLTAAAGGTGFCSAMCVTAGSGMTNASGALLLSAITPAPNTAACTSAFTGTAGMAVCNALLATTPAHNPLMANTNYTNIMIACIVACGAGNTCPTGLTCNAAQMLCLP